MLRPAPPTPVNPSLLGALGATFHPKTRLEADDRGSWIEITDDDLIIHGVLGSRSIDRRLVRGAAESHGRAMILGHGGAELGLAPPGITVEALVRALSAASIRPD